MHGLSRFRALFVAFLFLLAPLFVRTLHAQSIKPSTIPAAGNHSADSETDADDPDEAPAPSLYVNIHLNESGHASVDANLYLRKDKHLEDSSLKTALESALSCGLVEDANFKLRLKNTGFYFGSCDLPFRQSSFLRQGRLLTAPLVDLSRQNGLQELHIDFFLPTSGQAELSPTSTETPAVSRISAARHLLRMFTYNWQVDQEIPTIISFRYGYPAIQIQRGAVFLLLLLLAPLALVSWLGRRALSADAPDKTVMWFSYMRSLSWILNGSLLVWWAALDFFQVQQILRFMAAGTSFTFVLDHPAARQGLGWIPPSIVWLLCYRLSHPVQEKLRGLHWTKRELTLQALYSSLVGLFPFAMFLTGINLLTTNSSAATAWIIGAGIVRAFAAKALLKLTGMQPHALTTGPLRDRAFAIADQLGVKLQQVYLIPSGKGQMANAFASSADSISFTDFLLQRMSQREVEYVMAHELTHLKLKHPLKLGQARFAGFLVGFVLLFATTAVFSGPAFLLPRYLLMFGTMTAFPYLFSRRFEYAADAGAVSVTNDPRAAISALFKLAQLNMLPFQWNQWSEKWLSHPSSLRRAQAIAKVAGIQFEEIPAIARDGAADTAAYSGQSLTPPSKLLSSEFKKGSVQKLSYILLAILSFVPCFFALAARHFYHYHTLSLALFIIAIPATFAAVLVFSNSIPRLTRGNLARRLEENLTAQGLEVKAWAGIYVGLAPSAAPRSYEANSFWDVGYLFIRSDRICYWGEETQFALRREQITAIKLGMGLPGYLGAKRVYISWRNDELGTCGVFNLGCGHTDSVRTGLRQTRELATRLQTWWKTPSATRPIPAPLSTLSSPVTRGVTCAVPGAMWTLGKLLKELFATAWIAALGALLCGLPFHLMAYLMSGANAKLGMPAIHSPGAGWFVVLAAAMVRYLSLIPALRYRDEPILIAESPRRAGVANSEATEQSRLRSNRQDPVSVE